MACFGGEKNNYKLFSNNEYGEKYHFDENFKGPKSSRLATDVPWLWAFLVFVTSWLVFGIYVLSNDGTSRHKDLHFMHDENYLLDYLNQTLWCYLGPILIATVLCMIFSYAMRWIAAPAVWFSIFLMIASIICVAIGGFVLYNKTNETESNPAGLIYGIVFSTIAFILILYIHRERQKIAVAIALIKEGSKVVATSYSTVFFPIVLNFLQISVFAIFARVLAHLAAVGPPHGIYIALQMLNFFGFLWIVWFIDGFVTMILAHTYSAWYWTLNKTKLSYFTLTEAILCTTRYHLGTVAFGSMIITIVQLICSVIRRYTRLFNICCNINGAVLRLLQYFNKNTFIMVAIHGNPFCKSMRDAFHLLMRNIHSGIVTNRITKLPFAVFNLLIAAGMGGLTYLFLLKNDLIPPDRVFIFPIAISFFGSLIVGATFFSVHIIAVDTLFLCFLEDCERNDGTEQRPYCMPKSLMKILRKDSESPTPLPLEQA